MSRLLEINPEGCLPDRIRLRVGDVLKLNAFAGRLKCEANAAEILGPFVEGLITEAGILTPEGPPNILLVRAIQLGQTQIEIMVGHPWGEHKTLSFWIDTEH